MTTKKTVHLIRYEERALGAMLGLACGDAVGTTLEFTARRRKPTHTDMIGGGAFQLAPGQWTDDTAQALCLMSSLTACGRFDENDFLDRLLRWWRTGENSCTGTCFDIGTQTECALAYYELNARSVRYAPQLVNPARAGNGSLMRLAPAVLFARDGSAAVQPAFEQSRATHPNNEVADCVAMFACLLYRALNGAELATLVDREAVSRPLGARDPSKLTRAKVVSSGHVLRTYEAALWAVFTTKSFRAAVLAAANLGDDADTVAAVAGQLAGALYGVRGIPQEWLDKLAWRADIEARTLALLQRKGEVS